MNNLPSLGSYDNLFEDKEEGLGGPMAGVPEPPGGKGGGKRLAKVERLVEDIEELGMPEIVVTGVDLRFKATECFVNDFGFNFSDENTMGCISTDGTAELKAKDKAGCRRCYEVRRIRDDSLMAEIFWVK